MKCNQGQTQGYKIFRPQKVLEVQNVYHLWITGTIKNDPFASYHSTPSA